MATDLVINVAALREQAWRAEKVYADMTAYARRIGCRVVHDEIECHTEEQSRRMAAWWTENAVS